MASNNLVVTVTREHGSGGRSIAQEIARSLKMNYVDSQLIRLATQKLGVPEEELAHFDEKVLPQVEGISKLITQTQDTTHRFDIPLSEVLIRNRSSSVLTKEFGKVETAPNKPATDEEQRAAIVKGYHELVHNLIMDLAAKGKVVIVGRGSEYLLKNRPYTLRIFVYAPMSYRVRRLMHLQNISQAEAEQQIKDKDEQRANYTRHYFHTDWHDPNNYDLLLNTANLTLPTAVTTAVHLAHKFLAQSPDETYRQQVHSSYERLKQESYSLQEVSELFSINPDVVTQAIYNGELKTPIINHRFYRISREALLDWLKSS